MIEFMFSLVVFAIVTVGSLAALQGAQSLSENSRLRLLALDAARSTLESMKNLNLGLENIPGLGGAVNSLPGGNIVIDSVTSPPGANLNVADYARFTVFVYWRPKGSNAVCNRASNALPVDIVGCRNIRITTIRSTNFDD